MEYRIVLNRMEFRAFHGCYDLEQQVGNRFTVDLEITAELGEVASEDCVEKAVVASNILFGGATFEALRKLDEQTLLQVFEGVPQYKIARAELIGLPFIELCAERSDIFPSKGECRKMVQAGGVSLNKEKVADPMRAIAESDLIDGKYLLVQKGKKNYYLVIAE